MLWRVLCQIDWYRSTAVAGELCECMSSGYCMSSELMLRPDANVMVDCLLGSTNSIDQMTVYCSLYILLSDRSAECNDQMRLLATFC